jgi:hypothetical protein
MTEWSSTLLPTRLFFVFFFFLFFLFIIIFFFSSYFLLLLYYKCRCPPTKPRWGAFLPTALTLLKLYINNYLNHKRKTKGKPSPPFFLFQQGGHVLLHLFLGLWQTIKVQEFGSPSTYKWWCSSLLLAPNDVEKKKQTKDIERRSKGGPFAIVARAPFCDFFFSQNKMHTSDKN